MATLQPYKKYNAIAYDYETQLPDGWQLLPNIAVFQERIERGHINEELLSVTIGRGVIRQTEVDIKKDSSNEDKSKYKLIKVGDIAYNKMRMWQGALGYSDYQGISSPAYVILKPKMKINPRYFHYMFRTSFYTNYSKRFSYGIVDDQLSLRYTDFKRMYSIVPPIEVQNRIVAYLDEKNNEIDKFIRNKERLIELLEEEKINAFERLTRIGENEGAVLKFSGINWIGNINQDWEIRKVSHSFKKIGSGTTPTSGANEYYDNGIYPWVNTGDLNDSILSTVNTLITKKALKDYSTLKQYPKGTLLIAMYGATIGKASIMHIEACTNQACCALVPYKYFDTEFLFYWFKGNRNKIIALSYGGGQPNISQDVIRALRIPCPKIDEQKQLVKQILFEENRLNLIISKAKQEINSIKEYREALITDLVTGKRSVPQLQMR